MLASVSLIRADSYELSGLRRALEDLLEPLGGIAAFVQPGDRVLLKPNLLTGTCLGKECTTRAEVVYCVAQMVQAVGGKPFLGDGPAFGSVKGVARANGFLPLIEALKLPIVELHNSQRYQIAGGDTPGRPYSYLRLSKEAMEADVVINLPKVKSHVQLTLTLGVKNLFGCVPGKMKAWWHMEAGKDANRFGEMLVETARAISPDLTILDGIIGHEGNGPSKGEPRFLGLLGASNDVFALDRAAVEVLNVDPLAVPTVSAAERLGLCSNLETINFPHLQPQDLQVFDWQLPTKLAPIDFGAPRVIKSTFKHLYIRWIKEPISVNTSR